MKKSLKNILIVISSLALIFNIGYTILIVTKIDLPVGNKVIVDRDKYEELMVFKKPAELYSEIKEKFYMDISEAVIEEKIIQGIFESLDDKYSYYMTKEEFDKNYKNSKGELVGIGIIIEITSEGALLIKEVDENSPAELVGLRPGDLITAINSTYLNKDNTSSVINVISSAKKEYIFFGKYKEVEITYERNDKENKVWVAPVLIEDPEFKYEIIDNVGHIKIQRFIKDTPKFFEEALMDLNKNEIDKLIIDLRDNPGGLLDSLVESAGFILGRELILTTKGNYYGEREFYSDNEKIYNGDIVVLINENSASASEAFSAAIKDYERGTIIGKTSFGKGIVQNTYKLLDGSGYKITTSEYFSPKGKTIHQLGVNPDIISEDPLAVALNFLGK